MLDYQVQLAGERIQGGLQGFEGFSLICEGRCDEGEFGGGVEGEFFDEGVGGLDLVEQCVPAGVEIVHLCRGGRVGERPS